MGATVYVNRFEWNLRGPINHRSKNLKAMTPYSVRGRVCVFSNMAASPQQQTTPSSFSLLAAIRKHWFIAGVLLVISSARLAPWVGAKQGLTASMPCYRFDIV